MMTVDCSIRSTGSDHLLSIAEQFIVQGEIVDIQAFGSGNINDTFLVMLTAAPEQHLILQRINTQVFRQPQRVMQNMRTISDHIHRRLQDRPLPAGQRWEVPRVLSTQDAQDIWIDDAGSCWRAISFIEASRSLDTIQNRTQAEAVGYALGTFHELISDLPPCRLADTLEGFHITPRYLQHYEQVLATTAPVPASPEVSYCLEFVRERQAWASVLETAAAQGRLPLRPIHGDPKVNNVLMDVATGQAVSMIDLDTVKPGLIHYDIGDCLRSGCNLQGEETEEWQQVHFETDLCHAILQGYTQQAKIFLTENDFLYFYDAIRLLAFELGLRFLTDFWAGNVYFKTKYAEHNLVRALVQFKLTESIEAQEAAIRAIVQELR
jgi:Ser/Thr protein kinase RdoA (MazF antagonist)